MVMIAAYNLYLGGFLPEVSPKNSIHNKRELKNKYKSIVSLNNANPLVMVKLSADTQAYALNVKEMSMELSEASQDVDKKVYSYAHLYQSDIGTAYQASAFSGMLFNSYC